MNIEQTNLVMVENFEHILEKHNGIIYKISKSYAYYNYQDLYQEIVIQLWRSYKNFKGDSKLSTWIYRVAINTAITYKKKNLKNTVQTIENIDQLVLYEKDQDENNWKKFELLYQAINELKIDYKSIIVLSLEGYSYEEIADIIGITVNLVGVKISRTKKKLYHLLNKKGYGRL